MGIEVMILPYRASWTMENRRCPPRCLLGCRVADGEIRLRTWKSINLYRNNVMNNNATFAGLSRHILTLSRSLRALSKYRGYSTKPKPESLNRHTTEKTRSRIHRIQSRLPRFLLPYTRPLVNAPFSHISAFVILHEVTAIVPLLGLTGIFHYSQWMPPFISEWKWATDGVEKFGRYFRRKGWLGEVDEYGMAGSKRDRWWRKGEGGIRVVVE